MKANYKMTQSTDANALDSMYFPSPLNAKVTATPPFNPYELGDSSRRKLAWQIAPNLLISFRYAWAGVCYAFVTQRNFRIHTGIAIAAVSVGLVLKVTPVEMSILALTCALVMVLELLNTALESVVDLAVGQSYHELAKIAKDCAAGAVLISAMAALLVASFVLFPPLLAVIR
ncbi:diacylglycerol kinase family protein [Candidatus Gracilibacteria bacterium]|nr:diacylglycerol kinase family protein [Candidatus Gracilibacteria bacterium]NJM86767.1 diacylglycerol kinase family protein [Hydrococcus sp. RU_2_2]NJP17799.1 diacylglycerol kinase family protein [Hydrococcus sp. CRU_1_1]NJQ96883.1 diacylglycerol kinase family protein [Hydrococcus sp. CSU_1_8]